MVDGLTVLNLSRLVKEDGSVVTWGGPEGFDGFPSLCCSVVVLGMLNLSCNGSESSWKVVCVFFYAGLVSGTSGRRSSC